VELLITLVIVAVMMVGLETAYYATVQSFHENREMTDAVKKTRLTLGHLERYPPGTLLPAGPFAHLVGQIFPPSLLCLLSSDFRPATRTAGKLPTSDIRPVEALRQVNGVALCPEFSRCGSSLFTHHLSPIAGLPKSGA